MRRSGVPASVPEFWNVRIVSRESLSTSQFEQQPDRRALVRDPQSERSSVRRATEHLLPDSTTYRWMGSIAQEWVRQHGRRLQRLQFEY